MKIFLYILFALVISGIPIAANAMEKTFSFGEAPFKETATVSKINGQYVVTCSFIPRGKKMPEEIRHTFNLQRAKGICIKGIASFDRGKAVTRVSGNVRGLMEIREHEEKDGKLIYYFQVSSFSER